MNLGKRFCPFLPFFDRDNGDHHGGCFSGAGCGRRTRFSTLQVHIHYPAEEGRPLCYSFSDDNDEEEEEEKEEEDSDRSFEGSITNI
jgi:hypothetical protein